MCFKDFSLCCLSHIGEFKLKRVVVGVFQRLFSLLLVPHWGEMVHLIVYRLWVILLYGMDSQVRDLGLMIDLVLGTRNPKVLLGLSLFFQPSWYSPLVIY